uniref:stage III sporulation protein AF n=1 Tax=Agathobacter sp. TaxID=2021311 RepID=UPI004056C294
MLDFVRNYYVFVLILMIFSYLVPKEAYKQYIQFFISIFVIVLLLKPVLEILMLNDNSVLEETFSIFNEQLEGLEFQIGEQEDIFEHFFFEGEGE